MDQTEAEVHRLQYVEHGLRSEIRKLREALGVYAAEGNWRVLFEGGESALRIWVGPGEGPVLAKLALVSEVSEVTDEPYVG